MCCIIVITNFFFSCRVVEDVVEAKHLCNDGSKAKRVSNGSQPGSDVAQNRHNTCTGGGHHNKTDINVKNNCSHCNQIVQVWAGYSNHPTVKNNYNPIVK